MNQQQQKSNSVTAAKALAVSYSKQSRCYSTEYDNIAFIIVITILKSRKSQHKHILYSERHNHCQQMQLQTTLRCCCDFISAFAFLCISIFIFFSLFSLLELSCLNETEGKIKRKRKNNEETVFSSERNK